MTKLKMITWNVLYKEKADNILSLIEKIDPDIICCQEITTDSQFNPGRNVPQELADIFNAEYRYMELSPSLERQPASMGNAVISKFSIVQDRSILIQKGAPLDISASKQNRGYLEVSVNIGSKKLTVGTTHLSYIGGFINTPDRAKEANKLFSAITDNRKNFIIAGDFNSVPTSPTIKKLEANLKSVGPDHKELTFTTKPFELEGFRVDGLEWRLDYIFATPDIKVLSSKIIETEYSDHLPILAEVEI